MSHIVTLGFQPTSIPLLIDACMQLRWAYSAAPDSLRVRTPSGFPIMFRQQAGTDTLTATAEWEATQYTDALAEAYYLESAKAFAAQEGFDIVSSDKVDGVLEIVMVRE